MQTEPGGLDMSAAATNLLHTAGSLLIPPDRIDESPTNPRKHFDKTKMKELVESVRAHGVFQPILVRPRSENGKRQEDRYELVFGARRLRAAREAKLTHIPAIVRPMNDLEVLEAQVVENQQREDIHPLEEADGYHALHTLHGKHVNEIAAAVGKSIAYVYSRLRLVALCAPGREAFFEGKLEVTVALLIARMGSDDVQKKATAQLLAYNPPLGYAQAKEVLETQFMLELKRAPFNLTDANLVPVAGSCTNCPKRTGNQPELFPEKEAQATDRCTDPGCFKQKVDAHWREVARKAEESGQRVLGPREAKKLFAYGGTSVTTASGYVDLDETCWEDAKRRKYRQIVGRDVKPAIVRDPQGNLHEVIDAKEVREALKEKGVKQTALGGADAAEKRARANRQKLHALTDAVLSEIVEQATAASYDDFWAPLVAATVRHGFGDAVRQVVKRRGWNKKNQGPQQALYANLKKLTVSESRALFVELVLARDSYGTYSSRLNPALVEMSKVYGVNVKKVEKRLAGEAVRKKKARA